MPPPVPSTVIRPVAKDSTLVYYWVGAAASTYTLSITGPNAGTYTIDSNASYFTVSTLFNGSNYSATMTNDDGSESSAPAVYRTVEPGFKPSTPTSTSIVKADTLVTMTWQPPTDNGAANIGWYVITDLTDGSRYNTYGYESSITIPYVANHLNYKIQAVNDPGYSPPTYLTISISTLGSGGLQLLQVDASGVYTYTTLERQSIQWNTLIGTDATTSNNFLYRDSFPPINDAFGYVHSYTNASTNEVYRFKFLNTQNEEAAAIDIEYVSKSYIPWQSNDEVKVNIGYGTFFVHAASIEQGGGPFISTIAYLHQYSTNITKSTFFTGYDNIAFKYVRMLQNGVYFLTSGLSLNGVGGNYSEWLWTVSNDSPTLLQSTNSLYYTPPSIDPLTDSLLTLRYYQNDNLLQSIAYIEGTGLTSTLDSVDLSTLSQNIGTAYFGKSNSNWYLAGYNSNTAKYEYSIFTDLPNMNYIEMKDTYFFDGLSNGYDPTTISYFLKQNPLQSNYTAMTNHFGVLYRPDGGVSYMSSPGAFYYLFDGETQVQSTIFTDSNPVIGNSYFGLTSDDGFLLFNMSNDSNVDFNVITPTSTFVSTCVFDRTPGEVFYLDQPTYLKAFDKGYNVVLYRDIGNTTSNYILTTSSVVTSLVLNTNIFPPAVNSTSLISCRDSNIDPYGILTYTLKDGIVEYPNFLQWNTPLLPSTFTSEGAHTKSIWVNSIYNTGTDTITSTLILNPDSTIVGNYSTTAGAYVNNMYQDFAINTLFLGLMDTTGTSNTFIAINSNGDINSYTANGNVGDANFVWNKHDITDIPNRYSFKYCLCLEFRRFK